MSRIALVTDGQGWVVDRIARIYQRHIPGVEVFYRSAMTADGLVYLANHFDLIHFNNFFVEGLQPFFSVCPVPTVISVRSFRYGEAITQLTPTLFHVIHPDMMPSFSRATCIPDGIDLDRFKPARRFRVGMACHPMYSKFKGLDMLREAAVGLDVDVVHAADLPHEEMAEFYRSLDLYVCASESEGFSAPLAECMAMNIPVMSTRTGIATYLPGLHVVDRTVAEIRQGLLKHMTRSSVQELAWKVISAKIAAVYEQVIVQSKGTPPANQTAGMSAHTGNTRPITERASGPTKKQRFERISIADAKSLIVARGLVAGANAWHYSWDLESFFKEMFLLERGSHTFVLHTTPLNQWSPIPLYSNDHEFDKMLVADGHNPYWLLRLTGFDDFLVRRSASSNAPKKHFPTCETYTSHVSKMNCCLKRHFLLGNEGSLCQIYERWKIAKYNQSGAMLLGSLRDNNPGLTGESVFYYTLTEERGGEVKGVCITVEDSQSASLVNLASANGYGVLMLVELVKTLCAKGVLFFDAGVTGVYGVYKAKIFLDRVETITLRELTDGIC